MVAKTKKATATKKPKAPAVKTRVVRSERTSMNSQFVSVMVMIFMVLSIIFLLVVIQNYL